MSERLSGPAQAEANAQAHITALNEVQAQEVNAAHTEALSMDATFDKQNSIEARTNSTEVQQLNDEAQVAIFGTDGKTAGFVDLNGDPLTKPIKGKVNEISENPRYGTKKADREAVAAGYVSGLETLLDQGYEISQAKVVLDARELRFDATGKLATKLYAKFLTHGKEYEGRPTTPYEAKMLAIGGVAEIFILLVAEYTFFLNYFAGQSIVITIF